MSPEFRTTSLRSSQLHLLGVHPEPHHHHGRLCAVGEQTCGAAMSLLLGVLLLEQTILSVNLQCTVQFTALFTVQFTAQFSLHANPPPGTVCGRSSITKPLFHVPGV